MEGAVHIKVFSEENGGVVFEGKVSTDVQPDELVKLRYFRANSMFIKATNEKVKSFKGLQNNVELVAGGGDNKRFSGVLYVGADDGVVRKSIGAPLCACVMMSVWGLPNEECEKVFKCEMLEELEIFGGELRQIPREIGKMKKLKKLSLFGVEGLKSIPEEIGELSSLRKFDICGVESLPRSIGGMGQLEEITFKGLEAKSIPEEFGSLCRLKTLLFERCELESLPKSIGNLTELRKISILGCENLRNLPEEIGDLVSLKQVEILNCGVEKLPKRLRELKLLESIVLWGLDELELHPDDAVVFSRVKILTIASCEKSFSPSFAHALYDVIKSSTDLHFLDLDWEGLENPDLREAALEENGSIVNGWRCVVEKILKRNEENHERAMECVVHMLAIRRWKDALNHVPKEMVKMIAVMLWMMRCDVEAWIKM